jgi:hypothetical protein
MRSTKPVQGPIAAMPRQLRTYRRSARTFLGGSPVQVVAVNDIAN